MGARSSGRESALQMLFALEASGEPVERVISTYWRSFEGYYEVHPDAKKLADTTAAGVSQRLDEIDDKIREASKNWRLERMTRVDRNTLRLGVYELLARPDVPRAVVLDEAVELAKRYGTEESGAFVNGVLDRVAELLARPAR